MNECNIKPGVYALSEGMYTVGLDKIFNPFDPAKDNMLERKGSLVVEIQPFIIISEKDIIIIDPGLGLYEPNGRMSVVNRLSALGLTTGAVTKVLLSHLHKDHAGAVVFESSLHKGDWQLSFPNATYYTQLGEWDYAFQKAGSSYETEKLTALSHYPNLVLLDGNGLLDDYISYEISDGHTPYHQTFLIEANEEKYFYGGDVLPQFGQLQRRFIAKYDADGKLSADLRLQFGEKAAMQQWTCLFFHDLKTPFCKVALHNKVFSKL